MTPNTVTWAVPWSGQHPWLKERASPGPAWRQTSARLFERAPHAGNFAMAGALRGARILEPEALDPLVASSMASSGGCGSVASSAEAGKAVASGTT